MRVALVALALTACHRTPAPVCPVPKPIEIIQVPIGCLDSPPPAHPGPLISGDCGEGWVACLNEANARTFAAYLDKLSDYADLAFKRCEPKPTPLPDEGGL